MISNVHRIAGNTRSLQPGRLEHLIARAPRARHLVLFLAHAAGCLLVLAPLLVAATALAAAIYLATHAQGPLDVFMSAALTGAGAFGLVLGIQLFTVRPHRPAGVVVGTRQSPQLFAMIERRSSQFRVRSVDRVLLTAEAELRIVAAPALPLPFFHHRYLCMGAPMLFFLGRYPFRLALSSAIAAHACTRSSFVDWLNQASDDWSQILAALRETDTMAARLFAAPLEAIARTCDTLARPLRSDWRRRQLRWFLDNSNEPNAIDYLANQIVAASFLERQYWPMILKAAERCPTPVVRAFSHLPLLLNRTLVRQDAERWLAQAQSPGNRYQRRVPDLLADSRLEHLHWNGLPDADAFSTLFSSSAILRELDLFWQAQIEPQWRRRHARFQRDESRFQRLLEGAANNALRGESALHYVQLATRFLTKDDALAACRAVYATNTDDPKVCFAAGLALLRAGAVKDGAQALQRAAELEPGLADRTRALIAEHRQALAHREIFDNQTAIQEVCA